MTGDDILKLAGELFARDRSPSEALCRNIVGRAYYGAYHLAWTLLSDLGVPKDNNHKTPVRWLIESGERSAKRAGQLLDDLYAPRRRADYELDHPKAIAESRDLHFIKGQVELANQIKSLLGSCAVEPARAQVLAGIQVFRQRQAGQPMTP
jgi:hypothetical protein